MEIGELAITLRLPFDGEVMRVAPVPCPCKNSNFGSSKVAPMQARESNAYAGDRILSTAARRSRRDMVFIKRASNQLADGQDGIDSRRGVTGAPHITPSRRACFVRFDANIASNID
jgi:hypothetical protein